MSSIKIRSKRSNGFTQIRALITHPMETGRKRNQDNDAYIHKHFICQFTVKHNNVAVINSTMAAGIAKNPYFSFMLIGGESGDKISIHWLDNLGHHDSAQNILK